MDCTASYPKWSSYVYILMCCDLVIWICSRMSYGFKIYKILGRFLWFSHWWVENEWILCRESIVPSIASELMKSVFLTKMNSQQLLVEWSNRTMSQMIMLDDGHVRRVKLIKFECWSQLSRNWLQIGSFSRNSCYDGRCRSYADTQRAMR